MGAGSLADLVLLDRNPVAAGESGPDAAAHLRGMHVRATIVAGGVAFLG